MRPLRGLVKFLQISLATSFRLLRVRPEEGFRCSNYLIIPAGLSPHFDGSQPANHVARFTESAARSGGYCGSGNPWVWLAYQLNLRGSCRDDLSLIHI